MTRFEGLLQFCKQQLKQQVQLEPLSGDASFRRYYRVVGSPYLAVDSDPKTQKNELFIAIDQALAAAYIVVPQLIASDLEQGFLLISSLGETLFCQVATGDQALHWYQRALDVQAQIAAVKLTFVPVFDESFIQTELEIFFDWYLEPRLGVQARQRIISELQELTAAIVAMPKVSVHRDYHCRNLMICENNIAVIDFQDLVYGPYCYDVASLLYDCYVNLPHELIKSLTAYAYQGLKDKYPNLSYAQYLEDLRLVSLQRHLKVLGIFERLYQRDSKAGYLKDLPRVYAYTLSESAADSRFESLRQLLLEATV